MKHANSLTSVPQYRGHESARPKPGDVLLPASPRATLAALTELRDETLVDTVRAIALKDAGISAGVVRKWLEEE